MISTFQLSKTEPSCIGKIRITFTLQAVEVLALRFLLDPSSHSLMKFKTLWKCIGNYEKASFGLKELMPSIVNKLQTNNDFQQFHQLLKNDFLILSGLPKYTWTKNWYARSRLREIAQELQSSAIRFMVVKGMAETLLNPQTLNSRTCRDIDLLIDRKDLDSFTNLVIPLGWTCAELNDEFLTQPQLFSGNSFTFRHPDGIIDLDVHLSNGFFGWNSHPKFIQYLWSKAEKIHRQENYHIPNKESRILLNVWNLFDTDNLKSHQILKYLYDLMRELKETSFSDKLILIRQAQIQIGMGKEMTKLALLEAHLKYDWWQFAFFSLLYFLYSSSLRIPDIKISEKHYYWLYHTKINILSNSTENLHGGQIILQAFQKSRVYEIVYWKLVHYRNQSRARYFSYKSILQTKRDHCISYLKKSFWDFKAALYQWHFKIALKQVFTFLLTITKTIENIFLKICTLQWQQLKRLAIQIKKFGHYALGLVIQCKSIFTTKHSKDHQPRPTIDYYLSLNFLDSSKH